MDLQYEMMYQKHEQAIGERRLVVIDELSSDVPGLLLCRSQGEAPDVDPWILVYADEGHGYQPLVIRLYFRAILPSSISVKEASAKITVATTRDTSVF